MNSLFIGIIVSLGIGGYFYYTTTQNELIELRSLNAAYETKFETQENTINTMEARYENQSNAIIEMAAKNQEIIAERDRYLGIFQRHDLGKLANAKPGLIEPRVNNATKDVFDSLEADSLFKFDPTP
tara:strand:+ start:118 stop:498 length:381 start_codon:yes stop_codon:yes gene_type:complete